MWVGPGEDETYRDAIVGDLRFAYLEHPDDAELADLINALHETSPDSLNVGPPPAPLATAASARTSTIPTSAPSSSTATSCRSPAATCGWSCTPPHRAHPTPTASPG
ncbi:hypothetical protein WDZ17_16550 [Pseudokineococcus basanitobsidens]|uniref:Uncharacterized protein n=1 Tax=Pseudokineococcus basanitobsidens TaxID=1926649 RepID=A0ABU8RPK4_9ACTN